MFKDKLGKIFRRIFYIIFAVIVSVALWMYVEITENETLVSEVSGIEVVFVNEDILQDRLLLVSVISEPLTLTFEASRTNVSRLAASGAVTVTIDLAAISSTGATSLAFTPNWPSGVNPNDINILHWSTTRILLEVDRLHEAQIEVRAEYLGGTASEDLRAGTATVEPGTITVFGPQRIVSEIQYARVPILRENLATTYVDELEFILIDDDGEILDEELLDQLSFSHDLVRVVVPIQQIKEIPLTVMLAHGASTSEANTTFRIEPATITIAGDPEDIGEMNSHSLGTIDMLSILDISYTVTLPILIDNHIYNVSGELFADVHIEMIGLEVAFFSTPIIHVINLPPGLREEVLTQTVDIRVRGTAEDLEQVTPMNLRVFADVADIGMGSSAVAARVTIDGLDVNVDPLGSYVITVRITAE